MVSLLEIASILEPNIPWTPMAGAPRTDFWSTCDQGILQRERPDAFLYRPFSCIHQIALIGLTLLTGPGPQPLRGMSGFSAQPQAQSRNAGLPSARMPNGKMGMSYRLHELHGKCLGTEVRVFANI